MGDSFGGESEISRGHRQALLDSEQPAAIAERERYEARARARRNAVEEFLYGPPADVPYFIESRWDRDNERMENGR